MEDKEERDWVALWDVWASSEGVRIVEGWVGIFVILCIFLIIYKF